jgi:predicted nuclease with TOPRIM domain
MKRYVCAWGETAYKPVYLADEVDTERAKDREETESLKRKNELLIQTIEHSKEEIARLEKGEEQLSETAALLAVEIARLRKELEERVMISDRAAFLDDLDLRMY